MFIIHGIKASSTTQRVYLCCVEMGLIEDKDFKFSPVALEDLATEAYTAHQPFRQVPWLQDTATGVEMFESKALLKYIAKKVGSSLVPLESDIARWIRFEEACGFEAYDFEAFTLGITNELLYKPSFYKTQTNDAYVEHCESMFTARMNGYDRILGKTVFLAGNDMTLVDLFHLTYGLKVLELGKCQELVNGHYPNLARWWQTLSGRPSIAQTREWIGR